MCGVWCFLLVVMTNTTLTPLPEIPPLYGLLVPTILSADSVLHCVAYLIACFSITVALVVCIGVILLLVTFTLDLLCVIDFYDFWREMRDAFDFFVSVLSMPIRLY